MGFMLTKKGINVSPTKCKAILEMRSLVTVKEVQRLNGWIIALSWFMSKLAKKLLPFYKILKKDKPFKQSEDYEDVFSKLKEYMSTPPILTRSEDGETIFLYITAIKEVIRIVLIIEWDGE